MLSQIYGIVQERKQFSIFFPFPNGEIQLQKALIESLPCLVSKACQCIHKSLFRGVTM